VTRAPEEVLREAQTHFALMVQHAPGVAGRGQGYGGGRAQAEVVR
jgi:hypothetical protein